MGEETYEAYQNKEDRHLAERIALADVAEFNSWWVNTAERDLRRVTTERDLLKYQKEALEAKVYALERRVAIDPMTGLFNKTYFQEVAGPNALSRGMREYRKTRRPLAVVFLDGDKFKQINDHHGHDAGDYVIIGLGRHMEAWARKGDALGHIGGDEFAAVMDQIDLKRAKYNTPAEVAYHRAKQLVERVAGYEFKHDSLRYGENARIPVTISVGVALWKPTAEDVIRIEHGDEPYMLERFAGLRTAADEALLDSKHERNAVRIVEVGESVRPIPLHIKPETSRLKKYTTRLLAAAGKAYGKTTGRFNGDRRSS
ncbi:hypothetical protein COV18_05895 [Candidatus Woesearchaeota archaeon CG10_big_fil_rev_8_21_14_0_10_37_12]|nr:MAG: hypothetical protein COV18_05895 [Candidatus Woesearchaeota archaeon CG10_big_fil_rev_8_21_14_0_10_37_12]